MDLFKEEFDGISRETAVVLGQRLEEVIRAIARRSQGTLRDSKEILLSGAEIQAHIGAIFSLAIALKQREMLDKSS
jgi:hypothetical protein